MSLRALEANALRLVFRHHRLLLRSGVIAGVLCMGATIGWLITRDKVEPPMVLAVGVVPIALLVLYRLGRIEYGILAMLLSAGLLNFITLPTGTDSPIVISLLIAVGLWGMWIVQWLLVDKRIWLVSSPLNAPLLAFAAVNLIAYAWSNAYRDPGLWVWRSFPFVQLAALAVNMLLPMVALLVSNKMRETRWLRWLAWLMVGMGAVYILSYYTFSRVLDYVLNRGSSGLFATWVVALAYALALFNKDLPLWQRGLLLALVGVFIYRYFVQGRIWLSGWIPLIVVLAVITFLRSRKLFAAIAVITLVYVGVNYQYYYQAVYVANVAEGGLQRLDLWRMSLQHVARHPLFGMGPAGYAIYNMTYHPEDARSTHNNYMDVLAQTGIIGSAMFLWLCATVVWVGIRITRALAGRRNFEEAFAGATLAGWVAALVAMMLGDWVIPFAYNTTIAGFDHALYTWTFTGGLVSLYHIVGRRLAAADEQPTVARQLEREGGRGA